MSVAATGISGIPIEILERILNLLHDDPTALYSASLVARDWVAAPRHHIFHRTVIKEVWTPMRRVVLVHENVESFLALSQSRYCTILPAIRCVILCIPTTAWLVEVVKVLAQRAEGLSQVVFFQGKSSSPPSWMAGMLPDVCDFTFNTWSMVNDECWKLIASFPRLRSLALYTDKDTIIALPRDISGSSFSNIRNIQLRLLQSEELFDWMNNLDGSPLTRVEKLDIRIFRSSHKSWGSVHALNSFLKRNSKTMMYLSVAIDYEGRVIVPQDLSDEDINLSPLINLRSLFLQTHDMDSVCNSIASLESRWVESLSVHTSVWFPDRGVDDDQVICHCEFYDLFTKLARIMEEKQFISRPRTLQLLVLKQPRIDGQYWAVSDVSVRWTQSGDLTLDFAENDEYNKQDNTYSALRHLLL